MFLTFTIILIISGIIQENSCQKIRRLYCGDHIYQSTTTQHRFYDECWMLHSTDECIQGCIWEKSGLYHNQTFHFQPWYNWVLSDFGHHADSLNSEYRTCIGKHNPTIYKPDETCSPLKSLLSCMRTGYEKVCHYKTTNFVHTEADLHSGEKRCGSQVVPVPSEYLWYWNECSAIHGDWTECTKACQWHKLGIVNEDWTWNATKIHEWSEKIAPHNGPRLAEAQLECVKQFGSLQADFKNDPTCQRFKPFLSCWRDAYFNVCGHMSDWGIFSYKPEESAMTCQGKIYHSSPDHLKAYEECSKNSHLNFNCRYVCRLKKQGHILDDGTYNVKKIEYQLRRENPDKADALFEFIKGCISKAGPYIGSANCNKVEPYLTCLQDAYLQECGSVTFAGLSSWNLGQSKIKCKHFNYHRSKELIATTQECFQTTNSTYNRMVCTWKKSGYITENNTLNLAVWKRALAKDYLYTSQELVNELEICAAAEVWPIELKSDNSGIASFLSCLRQGFFDVCHFISMDFINTID